MIPYYQDSHVTIYHGDVRQVLPLLAAASAQTCVTSPPYFGLRDYGGGSWIGGDEGCDHQQPISLRRDAPGGFQNSTSRGTQPSTVAVAMQYRDTCGKCGATRHDQQIGLEPTPAAYVAELTGVFEQVRRVVTDTLWLNLGDSFNGSGRGPTGENGRGDHERRQGFHSPSGGRQGYGGLKPKDLIGIPWRVAFALQDAGWWLRSDIIWSKGNPMPESVTDRPTKAHEYLFLLAAAATYYYNADAIAEPVIKGTSGSTFTTGKTGVNGLGRVSETERIERTTRNKRSVWTVNTQPYPGAHFAVFPEKLIEPCILAGCPPGGTVLDPFGGSGTTARVAKRLGRRAILVEQNIDYCEMAAASLTQSVMDLEEV